MKFKAIFIFVLFSAQVFGHGPVGFGPSGVINSVKYVIGYGIVSSINAAQSGIKQLPKSLTSCCNSKKKK